MKQISILFAFFITFISIGQTGADCSSSILVSSSGCSATGAYSNVGIAGTISPSCFGAGTNNTMWFRFVASSPTVIVTVNGGTLTQTMVSLLDSPTTPCTGTFPELGCSSSTTATSTLTYSSLTVGNTYYIVVDGTNSLTGTFQLCLSSPNQPTNDNPCSAINLPASNFCSASGAYSILGATGELLTNTFVPPCFSAGNTMNSVYFTYTALGVNNTITINGSATGLNQPGVAILTPTAGCGGTTFDNDGCALAASGSNSVTLTANNLIPGNVYYVLVDGYGTNTGSFQICINSYVPTSTVVNDECTGAIPLCPNQNYTGTTVGATSTNDVAVASWACNGVVDNAVWFSFVTTNPVQPINFNINTVCTANYLQFEVFKKTGGGAICTSSGWTSQGCVSTGPVASTTLTIPAAGLTANTTYYVVCDNWPSSSCNFNFTITGNQGTDAGPDQQVCLTAAPFNMSGFTPAGGTWSGPGITNAALGTFSPAVAGIGSFVVYYTQGVCVDSKIVTVTAPQVTVSSDVSICNGSSTTLSGNVVTAATTYPLTFNNTTPVAITDNNINDNGAGWNGTGGNTSSIAVTGLNTGFSFSTITLNITHPNDADLVVYLTNPCGVKIRLIRTSGGTGDNYTNTIFSSAAINSISTGAAPYTGTYIPEGGSTAWAAFIACTTGNGTWTLNIGDDIAGNTGTLQNWSLAFNNPIPPSTYVWSPTTNMTNSTTLSPTVSPTTTTTYTLTGTDFFGCTNSDAVTVTVNPTPTVTVTNATVCAGTAATITATGVAAGGTYLWSTGATTASITVTPTTTTSYTVVYTLNGCPSLPGTGTVTVNPIPTVTVTNATVCAGTAATITATGTAAGGTYLWNTTETTPSIIITPGATTSYTVVYTLNGCPSLTGTGTVTVNPIPTVTVTNATVCAGIAATITATGTAAGGTYLWNTTETTPSITVTPATTTSYTVVYTSVAGCPSLTGTGMVTISPAPTVTVTNATVCTGTAATITATGVAAGGTYLWSNAATTASITVTPGVTTSYTVVYTLVGCSSLAGTGTVTVNPIPTVSVTSISTCPGSPATITATGVAAGGTYLWATGETTASITEAPLVSTTYSVVYTLAGCPSTSASGTISISTNAPINAGLDATICLGSSTTITAVGGATYTWDNGLGTGATFSVSPATTTTYTVNGTDISGCTGTDQVTITVNPIPTVTVTNATVCEGTATTITATGIAAGGTYLWDTGETTASITVSPSTTTSYTVVYTLNGCPSLTGTGTVTVNPIPTVTVTNATTCLGSPATITATGVATGGTYLWATGETTASITVSPLIPTTYSVIYTLAGCPSLSATGTVTISPNAPINAGSDATICVGQSTTLTATGGATYIWDNGLGAGAIFSVSPVVTTTYIVNGTDAGGCTGTDQVTITVNPLPIVDAGVDQTICIGASTITLAGSGAVSYSWDNGVTDGIAFTPAVGSITYTVTGTDINGCVNTDQVVVTVNPLPIINAGIDQTVCIGSSVTLSATGGVSYAWDNGITDGIAFTPALGSITYTVTGTDINGCVNTDQVVVTVLSSAPINAGLDAIICVGQSTTLTATGGATYTWDNGLGAGASFSVSPVATTTYTVNGTDINGCTGTDQVTITVNPLPIVNAGVDQTICIGASTITLAGSGAVSYAWDNGITDGIAFTPAVGSITYTVTGTDMNGCVSTDQVVVTVNPLPIIDAGIDQTICIGSSVTLSATGGVSYAWDNGITDGTAFTPALGSITYTVTGTDMNGCVNTDQVVVTVLSSAPINAGLDATICFGSATTISASGGVTYTWDNGLGAGATFSVSPAATTTYIVNGTDINGCTGTDQVIITVNPIPTVTVTNATVCDGTSATLTATGLAAGGTYLWNTTATTPSITIAPSSTTSYTVVYTLNGCPSLSGTGTVTVNPIPTVFVTNSTVCNGTTATLTATGTAIGGTYLWSNAATTSSISVTPATTTPYTVVYTLNGCNSLSGTGTVTVNPIPTVTVTNTTICDGTAGTLTATGLAAGGTYLWSNTSTSAFITVSPSITTPYTVVYTLNGCPSIPGTGTITVNPIPTVTVTNSTVCEGTTTTITATGIATGGTYLWNDGTTGPSITVSPTVTTPYSVIYTLNGCPSLSETGVVTINPNPIASFTASPVVLPNYFTESTMINTSVNATSYVWTFGDSGTSNEISPTHEFPNDVYENILITLTATSAFGCQDIVTGFVTIQEVLLYYVPNTFTPDGDGENDIFLPVFTSGYDPFDYTLLIFNRWGEIVFESHDAKVGWNGLFGSEKIAQDDVYTWKIDFKEKTTSRQNNITGHVNLVK